jgi:Protein of unknown function (DUF3800)
LYLLYLDESDTTSEEPDAVAARFCCLCGVRVVDSSYGKATKAVEKFLKNWPQAGRSTFEVKGRELFQGEGAWRGVKPSERVRFCKEFAALIASLNVKLIAATKPSVDFTKDYQLLLDQVIERVAKETAKTGSRTGRQLLVIFDRRPDFNVSSSETLRAARQNVVSRHKSACPFIDHGYEADSLHAPFIQVADFVAYFLRKQQTIVRESTLLTAAADARVVAAVDEIVSMLRPKVTMLAAK